MYMYMYRPGIHFGSSVSYRVKGNLGSNYKPKHAIASKSRKMIYGSSGGSILIIDFAFHY